MKGFHIFSSFQTAVDANGTTVTSSYPGTLNQVNRLEYDSPTFTLRFLEIESDNSMKWIVVPSNVKYNTNQVLFIF